METLEWVKIVKVFISHANTHQRAEEGCTYQKDKTSYSVDVS